MYLTLQHPEPVSNFLLDTRVPAKMSHFNTNIQHKALHYVIIHNVKQSAHTQGPIPTRIHTTKMSEYKLQAAPDDEAVS